MGGFYGSSLSTKTPMKTTDTTPTPIKLAGIRVVSAPKPEKPKAASMATSPELSDADPLLTTAEVKGYLKISTPTVHRWVRSGILKPKRLPGGGLRFRKSELDLVLA
jgi:excisionase family DNA binding protein